MAKVAIVVGATGLVGNELVNQLVAEETYTQVVTLTRKPLAVESDKHLNHVIDFSNLVGHAELLKGLF